MWRLIRWLLKLNDTFSNQTTRWIKTIYSVPEVRANEKACTKHYNWPHTRLIQRSSCFCSSHVSEVLSIHLTVSNRGPGGKETPPACWGSSFSENKFSLHTETVGPAHHQHSGLEAARGREVAFTEAAVFALAIYEFHQHEAYRLLTNTRAEPKVLTDAITSTVRGKTSKQKQEIIIATFTGDINFTPRFQTRTHRTALWLSTEVRPSRVHASPRPTLKPYLLGHVALRSVYKHSPPFSYATTS